MEGSLEGSNNTEVVNNGIDMEQEAKRIMRIVKKIKLNRNRACRQNILSFAQREKKELTMDIYKPIIDDLLARNILIDVNKDKAGSDESFKLGDTQGEIEELPEVIIDNELDETCESMQQYIDEKFENILLNNIKNEVRNALHNSIIAEGVKDIAKSCESKINSSTKENDYLKELIMILKADIQFLRNEVQSKDKIIELLIKNGERKNNHENINLDTKSTVSKSVNVKHAEKISDEKNNVNEIKKRCVVILGDSIVKDIDQHKVRKGLFNNEKVYVKNFSGATVNHMKSYVIPTKSFENDLIILHCGTNDLRSAKNPNDIAEEIIELALDMKTEKNELMISGIVPRRDKFNGKGMEVNKCLISLCNLNKMHYIDNTNVNTSAHLNMSGLHLNQPGSYVLGGNFVNAIKL